MVEDQVAPCCRIPRANHHSAGAQLTVLQSPLPKTPVPPLSISRILESGLWAVLEPQQSVLQSPEVKQKLFWAPFRKKFFVFPPKGEDTRRAALRRRLQTLTRTHDKPRFQKIHFHTFGHCKALKEYHKNRSMLYVKRILGGKSVLTTQRCVELYTDIYGDLHPQDYVCETASTVEDAKKLVKTGFEYVSEIQGEQPYRKVK